MTKFQKTVKKVLTDYLVDAEAVSCSNDGTVKVRDSYFYRHDRTAEKWGAKVMEVLEKQLPGQVKLVKTNDKYQSWPKLSYFEAFVGAA